MSKNQITFCIITATILASVGIAIMANLAKSPVKEDGGGGTEAPLVFGDANISFYNPNGDFDIGFLTYDDINDFNNCEKTDFAFYCFDKELTLQWDDINDKCTYEFDGTEQEAWTFMYKSLTLYFERKQQSWNGWHQFYKKQTDCLLEVLKESQEKWKSTKIDLEKIRQELLSIGVGITEKSAPTFDDLLDAIEYVESKGDANAVGDEKFVKYLFDGRKVYEYQAIGTYQLHKIYVDDVNRIMQLFVDKWQSDIDSGKVTKAVPVQIDGEDIYQFTYADRWDKEKSKAMVQIYTEYYATKAWDEIWDTGQFMTVSEQKGLMKYFELQARIHNGGPQGYKKESTIPYWLRVKERLETK